MPLIDIVMEYS